MLNTKAIVYLINQCQPENECIFCRTAHSLNVGGDPRYSKNIDFLGERLARFQVKKKVNSQFSPIDFKQLKNISQNLKNNIENMTFDKIINSTPCDCFQETFEDYETHFALKINKSKLREADFRTYWEKGRTNYGNCKEACSLKSQSISIVKKEIDIEKTLNVYKSLFPISPKYKPYCAILVFKEKSGKIKLTPSKNNPLHCDFYKSDTFTTELLEVVETISLENV